MGENVYEKWTSILIFVPYAHTAYYPYYPLGIFAAFAEFLIIWTRSCKQEVSSSSSVRLCANLSFCLPLPGCPCSRSGAGSEMKPCQSSAGLRVAFSSTPEDLLAATRPRKEPWKWHGEPCRPPHLPLPLRMEAAEWTASGTSCVLLGCL